MQQRTFDEDGRIDKVMYFDVNGKSTTGLLGQYDEAYDYDEQGRRYKTAFLGQNGNSMVNIEGYALV